MSCAETAFGQQTRKHVDTMTQATEFLLNTMPNAIYNRSSIPGASLGFEISTFRRMVVAGGARGWPDFITPASVDEVSENCLPGNM